MFADTPPVPVDTINSPSLQMSAINRQNKPASMPLSKSNFTCGTSRTRNPCLSGWRDNRSTLSSRSARRSDPCGYLSRRPRSPSRPCRQTSCCPCSRSEEHTSELQSHHDLVCRLLLEKKKKKESDTHSKQVKQQKVA